MQAAEKQLARLGIMEIGRADTAGGEESVGFWREGMQPPAFPIEVASWPFDLHHGGEIKPSRCSASSKVKLEGPKQMVERVIHIRREQPNPDDRRTAGNRTRRGRVSTICRFFWFLFLIDRHNLSYRFFCPCGSCSLLLLGVRVWIWICVGETGRGIEKNRVSFPSLVDICLAPWFY